MSVDPEVTVATAAATGVAAGDGTDTITLTGLRVFGRHGVLERERRDGQDFVVDATLMVDTRAAAASDDLADTIDYGALARTLGEIVAGQPANLIETVAGRLVVACLTDPRVRSATVTLHKPRAPIQATFADVAVTVTRRRETR